MKTNPLLQIIKYAVLALFTFVFGYPIFLMIVSSFKENAEIFTNPLSLPTSFNLDNYIEVWEVVNFSNYIVNSLIVSSSAVFIVLFVSSLAGYYLSRYRFKWNPYLLGFFMIGLMLPMKLAVIPLYMTMLKLGLVDTLFALIFIYVAGGIPFAVFLFYGFFRTVPRALEDSARLDGCNDFQVYYRIVLPIMKPAISIVGIVNLINVWNDFFYPLIFIRTDSLSTIPLGMLTLFGEYDTQWNLLFAGLTLSSLPMIIAFLFASRQFMDSLTEGAVK
ncbi:carbohydrate ABC transporter permease [Oceanobacillus neutriphilus]|uniref:Sugar ABC transporter permease n=1 Tax=Oceanobacillus neutriphilus TaxID=531815 RepID=A0ABQ2NW63_9BACI|nr:carbohydrate ABC transporter permease [Oceanobacillus neutriphilus]GGP12051.1 sugar ABC transporter permease [Oceanobacillus neutriphilus]